MKKLIFLTCISTMLYAFTAFGNNITVTLNDTAIAYTQNPVLKNNTTCVPMKQTLEAFGAIVSWNEPTKTVIARKGNLIVSACQNSKTLIITKGEQTNRITMPVAAYIENGTMFVPLRPLSQAFQADMTWNSNTNTANINMNNSFILQKTDKKTIQNKTGDTIWQANISYPELQGESEAFLNINETIKNDVYTSLSAAENDVSDDVILESAAMPYSFDCDYSITYLDDNTISFLLDYYGFTGGAHGMPFRKAYTFDLNTGNQLQLKDILNIEDIESFVKDAFKNNIEQNSENYFSNAIDTVNSEQFLYDFYIEQNKIVLFTQPYLLEPYANHYQPTIIDTQQIQNILKIQI